ncbi:hypothetical protein ZWY2020_022140 [Hordeum vulgare]|nr:hypothetical protein ZWY2020_022140 [Hordeum vulgare]
MAGSSVSGGGGGPPVAVRDGEAEAGAGVPAVRRHHLRGILLIWFYRATHIPARGSSSLGWRAGLGLLVAELWFGLYWVLTLSVRWNPVRRTTFKDRLSASYDDDQLPAVDIFVCTADPDLERPMLVISTVLSVMAYDYPPEKLNIYLSDDAGSAITFYALHEASEFAKHWIPFCKNYKVEPRSPAAYFAQGDTPHDACSPQELLRMKILIDRNKRKAVDVDGNTLPKLVYMAREKRPQEQHHFKAGSLNALIRISSVISNSPVILNVDCDIFPTFYYVIIPSLCFLSGVSVFPEITSPWCIPFIYVVVAAYSWSLMESLQCGDTAVEWWNAQRMWLKRRTTSYLLAAIDTIGGMLGISESGFELTVKVDESQAMERYKKGKMEFGPISGMFVIITTISLFNLACLVLGLGRVLLREGATGLGPLFLQAVLCMAIVVINAPVYEALFIRRDSGSLPYFFTLVSLCFVSSLCLQAT